MEGEIQDENKKGHHEHGLRGGRRGDGIKNAHGGLVPIARGVRLPQTDEQRQEGGAHVKRGFSGVSVRTAFSCKKHKLHSCGLNK